LIVYASGGELTAIPDRPTVQGAPSRIGAVAAGNGVILRRDRQQGDTAANGWTLALPHPDESMTSLELAGPVHLSFTTLTPDGRARSYLIDAASGESATLTWPDGVPRPAVTGLPFDERFGAPVTVMSPVAEGKPTKAGELERDTFEVSLWRIDGDTAHLMQQARLSRRRGRLGWRELIRTSP
jgi:type IV pilus assembly protein PilY1